MKHQARRLLCSLLLIWIMSTAVAAQEDLSEERIRIDTDLVVLRVTVSDRKGRAVLRLGQEDFKALEDGAEQPISFFSTEESPASWGLVLDRSGSMMGIMHEVYQAALHVIDEGTSQDEMFIVTFSDKPKIASEFTSDRRQLENSLQGIEADGQTAFYDAVSFALDRVKKGKHRKKVLVVFTDGKDNRSRLKFQQLVERAKEEDVLIYLVGMFESIMMGWDASSEGNAMQELEKLAEVTGTSAHFPRNIKECRKAMKEIASEVSQQYSLGYYPTNKVRDGKWRGIRIVLKEKQYVARTRTGYYSRKVEGAN